MKLCPGQAKSAKGNNHGIIQAVVTISSKLCPVHALTTSWAGKNDQKQVS